jgi:hypothetical protein
MRRSRGPSKQAFEAPLFDFFGRRWRCEILVQAAGIRFGDVTVSQLPHDRALLLSVASTDLQLIAFVDETIWFGSLTVDLDLAAFARFLGF